MIISELISYTPEDIVVVNPGEQNHQIWSLFTKVSLGSDYLIGLDFFGYVRNRFKSVFIPFGWNLSPNDYCRVVGTILFNRVLNHGVSSPVNPLWKHESVNFPLKIGINDIGSFIEPLTVDTYFQLNVFISVNHPSFLPSDVIDIYFRYVLYWEKFDA